MQQGHQASNLQSSFYMHPDSAVNGTSHLTETGIVLCFNSTSAHVSNQLCPSINYNSDAPALIITVQQNILVTSRYCATSLRDLTAD